MWKQWNAWKDAERENDMKLNNKKYEYMSTTQELGKLFQELVLGSDKMKKVENFEYLGIILEQNGRNDKQANKRG